MKGRGESEGERRLQNEVNFKVEVEVEVTVCGSANKKQSGYLYRRRWLRLCQIGVVKTVS